MKVKEVVQEWSNGNMAADTEGTFRSTQYYVSWQLSLLNDESVFGSHGGMQNKAADAVQRPSQ